MKRALGQHHLLVVVCGFVLLAIIATGRWTGNTWVKQNPRAVVDNQPSVQHEPLTRSAAAKFGIGENAGASVSAKASSNSEPLAPTRVIESTLEKLLRANEPPGTVPLAAGGQVLDPSGHPASGVRVSARRLHGSIVLETSGITYSDPSGHFTVSFRGIEGRYVIRAQDQTYLPQTTEMELVSGSVGMAGVLYLVNSD